MREQQPPQTAVTTSIQRNPPTTQNMRAAQPSILSMHVATRHCFQRSYIVSRIRDLLALPTEGL